MTRSVRKYLSNKRWNERNPDRNWAKLHRKEATVRLAGWKIRNPEKYKQHMLNTKIARQNKLKQLKEDFGGKCKVCGYMKCMSALEFHHLDPKTKLFTISGGKAPWAEIVEEAKKCVLLCSNCHREVEEGLISL
ncbi:MAG: hypothetical protein C5B59_08595 [Bacteroidetes bacterium]|nr:MAG: hypothetical protein C5B59_08595 [Bacteroidota bacterium]